MASPVECRCTLRLIRQSYDDTKSKFLQDEPSKFGKKSKTLTDNPTESTSKIADNLNINFDSDDSFEIPETQSFPPPPTDQHDEDDDLDSEAFITMPVEAEDSNDCSQSQVILNVIGLGQRSPDQMNFVDEDSVDLEMSKLQWEDSTKENREKDDDSASVTPDDLNFDVSTKRVGVEDDDSDASVTPDLDFDPPTTTAVQSILDSLASPKQFKVPSEPGADATEVSDRSLSSRLINVVFVIVRQIRVDFVWRSVFELRPVSIATSACFIIPTSSFEIFLGQNRQFVNSQRRDR